VLFFIGTGNPELLLRMCPAFHELNEQTQATRVRTMSLFKSLEVPACAGMTKFLVIKEIPACAGIGLSYLLIFSVPLPGI